MNIYDEFFEGISPNDWELFAEDFFIHLGFYIIDRPAIGADGGTDLKVGYRDKKYIVSCKHFIISGNSVKPSDEQNIVDRVGQHHVDGFIGFYSTQISSGLSNRFKELNKEYNKKDDNTRELDKYKPIYTFDYFDKSIISNVLPDIDFIILQKYGFNGGLPYIMNVTDDEYEPLNCIICNKDILHSSNIEYSKVALYESVNNKLICAYGCKSCLPLTELAVFELKEVLYMYGLNKWNNLVHEYTSDYEVEDNFYEYQSNFNRLITQITYPQNLCT